MRRRPRRRFRRGMRLKAGDAGRRETTFSKVMPVPRRPWARPPPGSRTCHVTASSTASATRLVAALLQAPSPPWRERQPLATDLSWPTAPDPPRLGQVVRYLGMPQDPVRKDRFAETPCVARRGPKRWRNRATDAGAVSSFQAPRPGPSRGLPRGRRAVARNHIIGILSIFFDRTDARRARGPGLERGSHASESHPCAMSPNHAAVRFPRCR